MKKSVLMFVIVLICIYTTLVSASYVCSNATPITEGLEEIDAGKSRIINGLGIGLIAARDMGVARRFTAEIIVDARRVSLDNITSSQDIEILSGVHTVRLVNSTNENAAIKIDESSKKIIKGESDTIKSLEVFLVSSEGEYPWRITVLVGKERISLSSDENPSRIVVINGTDYLLELFSASNSNAAIKVKKCENGKIVEVKENITSENITLVNNRTISEELNKTKNIDSENKSENKTGCGVVGFRKENAYCAKNKSLSLQKEKEDSCSENYECKTDYCKSEKCAGPGILTRIILWFKNLFS